MSKYDDDRYKTAYKDVFDDCPTHSTMDRLTAFLYVLMRDHLPAGVVAGIVIDANVGEGPSVLSNGYLAKCAEHFSYKLRGQTTEELLDELENEGVQIPSAFRKRQLERKGKDVEKSGTTTKKDVRGDG